MKAETSGRAAGSSKGFLRRACAVREPRVFRVGVAATFRGLSRASMRAALLYTAFINGSLPGRLASFDGSIFTYEHSASGHALQEAIWHIEEEIGPVAGLAASLVAMADAAVGFGGEWFGMGLGAVRVMNMADAGGHTYQDLLVLEPTMIPLPAPVFTGAVGLAGVIALTLRRRRACGDDQQF